jgi:hypothetical protein
MPAGSGTAIPVSIAVCDHKVPAVSARDLPPCSTVSCAAPAGMRAYDTRLAAGPADQVLLWTGNEPVASVTTGPLRQVRTILDLDSAVVSRQPEYALLIATLLDSVSGQAQLNKVAGVAFDRAATRIAPERLPVAATPARARGEPRSIDFTAWLLAAALCVLAWDILATARQSRTIGRFTVGA